MSSKMSGREKMHSLFVSVYDESKAAAAEETDFKDFTFRRYTTFTLTSSSDVNVRSLNEDILAAACFEKKPAVDTFFPHFFSRFNAKITSPNEAGFSNLRDFFFFLLATCWGAGHEPWLSYLRLR